ncbi:MAG: DEAD/DEAH box helicase [Methanobacteriaceae archaeon]|jgi:SNF2 family DNA or RNA helicase/uncharacterized Zn finger protein|nr:DEAD/DEAH box helicase [Methanobacteriaceae archaeon]
MVNYGKTWWGEKWLDAVEGVDFTNRIPRGKTYANTGKVYDIQINDNIVTAKVEGNYAPYYKVTIMFKSFNRAEKEIIAELINNSSAILSGLLNNKLPENLHDELSNLGIELFPKSWDDINADCNCPDYAPACKHIAGLIYMISLEIDKDPFKVFKLHDCDLFSMIDHFEDVEDEKVRKIKELSEVFKSKDDEIISKKDSEFDFSKIPNLHDTTFLMLESDPVFYEKDFKAILSNFYKSISRFSKKLLINKHSINNSYNDFVLLKETKKDHLKNRDKDLDKSFTKKWSNPHLWGEFKINIDDNYKISNVFISSEDKRKSPFTFKNNESLEILVLGFLVEINYYSHINKFNENIKFLDLLLKFTIDIIKNQAIIPELYKTKDDSYIIRWVPALYDKEIRNICENFYMEVPDDLVSFNNHSISKKQSVISIISLLIKGILNKFSMYGISQKLEKNLINPQFKLFLGSKEKFKGDELLIDQWLSNFTLKNRDYTLYLHVEEFDEDFTIDLKVKFDDELPKTVSKVISDKDNYEITDKKLKILSDIYLIKEHLPEIENSLDFKKDIRFNLDEFSEFFINILPLFDIMGISIILPKSLKKIYTPKLVLNVQSTRDIKNQKSYLSVKDIAKYDWKVAIGSKSYSKEEFEKLVEKSKGLVKIANEFVVLDENQAKSFIKKLDKVPSNLNQNDLVQAILSGELDEAEVDIDNELKTLINNINKKELVKVPKAVKANLRDYQKTGYSWLVQNINTGFGSILADDMGLGKTLQVLTTIMHFKEKDLLLKEKVLVVMPSSLLFNWQREIRKFTPGLKSIIYHGNNRKFPKKDYDIVLTSYGIIRKDEEKFKKMKWFLIVIDEAQNIKNPLAMQTKSIKAIKSKHKIALSGTPVENRLSEYWSIFDFTNKNYLSSPKKFMKKFIQPIEKERNSHALEIFKEITNPFILRRVKTDKSIINDLPDKVVNDVFCNLTVKQSAIYQETLNSLMETIDANEGINRKGMIFKLINSLKQICNHPSQFIKNKKPEIEDSGKMEALINILDNILASDEKVLIFTQYVQMGEIIQELIEKHFNTKALFLHGSLTRTKRDKIVAEFQNNSQKKIFIISLKAGGTGLNLTAAQNVIHYDLWWNPAVENQATDRAYRIGQKENVMVYRFISSGTFEEKINKMIKEKSELSELAVSSGEKFITEMGDKELKNILKLRK